MVSICCVGFASLDVVCNELNDWPGMFVCSSFLISVCMFIMSKALLSECSVIVRAGAAIWLNPFATVLFTVCSAVSYMGMYEVPLSLSGFGIGTMLANFHV